MSNKECILCNEEKPESDGEIIEETETTKQFGIPTGFVCGDCIDDAPEYDGPDMPLDLSQYSTAAGAAKALHGFLIELAESMDRNTSDITLYDPEEAAEKRDGMELWTVSWEGGPYEWAIMLTGGESMFSGESGSLGSDPEVTGFSNSNWTAEPYYKFDLQFTNH